MCRYLWLCMCEHLPICIRGYMNMCGYLYLYIYECAPIHICAYLYIFK